MLSDLLCKYAARRSSVKKVKSGGQFDANAAFAEHTRALRTLTNALVAHSTNDSSSHAFDMAHKIGKAIEQAERRQQYAARHNNFCLRTATRILNNSH